VRPAVLFGGDEVLVNNIAWLLRRLPVFAIGGRGAYRIGGIHVQDVARVCVAPGRRDDAVVIDAVGPQSVTFRELVGAVRAGVGSRAVVVPASAALVPLLPRGLGMVLRHTLLTGEEYHAMADGLAWSDAPATGQVVLTEWLSQQISRLGRTYANELDGTSAARDSPRRPAQHADSAPFGPGEVGTSDP
jgi:hypothetical protein